ncbi:MAG: hypothetical protein COA47_10065 [Robiginitomaculum sp.]|nr:MAG: hypothetical protein COA47_10065 [Robiginitomaculum sp.]
MGKITGHVVDGFLFMTEDEYEDRPNVKGELLPYGTIIKCIKGYEWVYVGYSIKNTVGRVEHFFYRTGECDPYSRWCYNATFTDTLCKRFPDLEALLNGE